MLCNKQKKLNLAILLIAVAVLVSGLAVTAWAKKPVKPPKPPGGGGGSVGTGTIYYASGGLWSMNPDGSGRTLLPVGGVPSITRHPAEEDRWFLQMSGVPGFYPIATSPPLYYWMVSGLDDLEAVGFTGDPNADLAWGTIHYYIDIDGEGNPDTFKWYAQCDKPVFEGGPQPGETGVAITGDYQELLINGSTGLTVKFDSTTGHRVNDAWWIPVKKTRRHELFAVSEDGLIEVQLTDDPNVQPRSRPEVRWATHDGVVDGKVSYLAQLWGKDAQDKDVVLEQGLFAVEIAWIDGTPYAINPVDGNPTSVPVQPTMLPVSELYDYDWSPDGAQIVYLADGIRVTDAYVEGPNDLLCDGYGPRWSPVLADDTTLIAFGVAGKEIRTISPDGGPATTIVALGKNRGIWSGVIYWSPMGTHLVYTVVQSKGCIGCQYNDSYDVYRVGADGSNSTNLTNGIKENCFSVGWRD